MNFLDIQMFCKGMQSITLFPKDIKISIEELNEDIKNYYKNGNIHNFDALDKIMKMRLFGQGFLFIYIMTILGLVVSNVNLLNESFLVFIVSLIILPYIFSYFVLKK